MRRLTSGFWRAGLLVGLLLALTLSAVGCGEDEQSESAAQQAVEQESAERQDAAQQQEAAAAQQIVQEQTQQAQTEAQSAAQQEAQATDSAAQSREEQQSQTQAASSETAADQGEEQESAGQQSAQQQSRQSQQAQQAVEAESVPEGTRLISLFGDVTEIVYALGAEAILVARDASSIYPPEAEGLPNLGFAGALNAEAMLGFEPTLVIGTSLAGPPGVLEQLEQAGVRVLILDELKGLDAPQIKFRVIGEALGIPRRAEELALDVEKRTQAVMAAAQTDKPLRVLHVYIRRGGLQLVSGQGNEAQTIIEAAGGIDAAAEAGIVGWQPLTPEALVAADPDVYLVMDRGLEVIDGIEGLLAIPGMSETKAGRGEYIISMPDLYLLGFGPRLPEAIADLSEYLRTIQAEIPSE